MAKRKTNLKTRKKEIEEFEGYKLDQLVYCFRYPDNKLTYGKIEEFHLNTEGGPAFTIIDFLTSKYRLALIVDIIDNPTPKQLEVCRSAIKISRKKKS